MAEMADLNDRKDIEKLISAFYKKMLDDIIIGYIFTEVARVNLDEHIYTICDFWEAIIFSKPVYKRGSEVIQVHIDLNKKVQLKRGHFKRWLYLFHSTIDELFEGPYAELAKQRSISIAETMQKRLAS